MTNLKKTPLFDTHAALGAKIVPFAGFEMPVSYAGILEEHRAVREHVGLFDVSHMGEFFVSGPGTFDYLNRVATNNCKKLPPDGVLYSVMCRKDGTVVDDLLVTRLGEDSAFLVVNASNIDKDFAHMQSLLPAEGVTLENRSDDIGLLAVQGPDSRELLKSCPLFATIKESLDEMGYYRYRRLEDNGDVFYISRTGYTGEVGFEIFAPASRTAALWDEIAGHGKKFGLSPVGLAARDTLRFEAAFCLYGHELDDETSPLEAGLNWVVKFKKPGGFEGFDTLIAENENGSRKKLVGLELEGRNIARQGYAVMSGNEVVGKVTSGTFSPTLEKSLCMAYIDADRLDSDSFDVQVRKKAVKSVLTPLPFYASRAR
jgi:aminomethyltransferase